MREMKNSTDEAKYDDQEIKKNWTDSYTKALNIEKKRGERRAKIV